MAEQVPVNKRTLKQVFQEAATTDKKLTFDGPDKIRPDSRYAIIEISEDHVTFRLLGDERYIIPYSAISTLKLSPTALTIRYH